MKIKQVNRYTCDFCGKKGYSKGHMRKHELHCTKNPDRECRVCKMVEGEQKPLAVLLGLLPTPIEVEDEYGFRQFDAGTTESVNEALKGLRDACDSCPACIMAALRQKGIPVPMATDFNFSAEMKSLWADINDAKLQSGDYY